MKHHAWLLVALLLWAFQKTSLAYMWPLVFSGPHPDSQDVDLDEDLEEYTINHPRSTQLGNRLNDTMPCQRDKSCGKGFFCDLHYGNCRPHKSAGEPCRRDGHCERGFDCRFGTCQTSVAVGALGARCRSDKDCSPGQCCAKQHGESICKAKLQVGAKCYVPEGGVDYVIDTICPCDSGLICKLTRHHRRAHGRDTTSRFWTDHNHMRCQPL
ncbi:Dickkopf-related protein 3 [Holothuria leucospilota]|uniref:Dickkopf-related protein 3 n=1 Tax=Holothuria leucospilota TaxID=206669 RepID=A0A9Q0YLR1_HOLLE|nr:Dickkopf-related protein 3 [Holothuria leucospilota]